MNGIINYEIITVECEGKNIPLPAIAGLRCTHIWIPLNPPIHWGTLTPVPPFFKGGVRGDLNTVKSTREDFSVQGSRGRATGTAP